VEITAALAADLAVLSEALDETDGGLADALRQLVADVKVAVPSYLGLTIVAGNGTYPMTLTAMEPFTHPSDVVSSLVLPLADDRAAEAGAPLVLILYAARPDAFVDLAADLGRLTGRPLRDFALDQHLVPPAELDSSTGVRASSLVHQAIGVLIGRGYTPEEADLEIELRAAADGNSRAKAADIILARLRPTETDPLRED
jgi:hypothetical protein